MFNKELLERANETEKYYIRVTHTTSMAKSLDSSATPEVRAPIMTLDWPSVFLVLHVRACAEALMSAMARAAGLQVVGAGPFDSSTLALIASTAPTVIVADSEMVIGSRFVYAVTEHSPRSVVVAFGVREESLEILACAEAGVAGLVPLDASLDDLVRVVVGVARGEFPASPRVAAAILRHVARHGVQRVEGSARQSRALTMREMDIVRLVSRGKSNKEIAGSLGIEVATAKNHMHRILEKLGVARRGAIAQAVRLDAWTLPAEEQPSQSVGSVQGSIEYRMNQRV
jgi:two-component system nitrate/nitrite response regulator NarL